MKTDVRINNTIVDDRNSMVLEARLTPDFLAELFWNMDGEGQACFFNQLGVVASGGAFAIQMGTVTATEALTNDARYIMRVIGDHAEKQTKEA